jgi:ribosomal protein S18 acetylase RimI-like enzyme
VELGPLVHLGIWADNDGARRLYTGLGFSVRHRVENLRPVR